MKAFVYLNVCLLTLLACQSPPPQQQGPVEVPILTETMSDSLPLHTQLLLVTTRNWDAVAGVLRKFEWKNQQWQQAGDSIAIRLGRKGLAWGIGLEDFRDREGPVKIEGDKKSPAGVFRLGTAFGYANEVRGMRYPYHPIGLGTMCIEDKASTSYNHIIEEAKTESDWNSTDHMLRKDDLYKWGVFVEHNAMMAEPGAGSCIFLHVWNAKRSGTAGCTSMDQDQLEKVLTWLDGEQEPILVQSPVSAYAALKEQYKLPNISGQ